MASLLGPAVVAAVVSAFAIFIVAFWNQKTTRAIHKERLAKDAELAERKLSADLTLTRAKALLDFQVADWKRKSDFAEQLLADFYRARDIFKGARNPFAFGGDGSSRPNRENEEVSEQRRKDSIFAPLERLQKEREFLTHLHSQRFRAEAIFGDQVNDSFFEFVRAFNAVSMATSELIESFGLDTLDSETRKEFQQEIGWTKSTDDPIAPLLNAAVSKIEKVCREAMSEKPTLTEVALQEPKKD